MSTKWDDYRIAKHSIQMTNTKLFSMECRTLETEHKEDMSVTFGHRFNIKSETEVDVFLKVTLTGPFEMDIVYQGECKLTDDKFTQQQLIEFLEEYTLPFLLPYSRECIASTLARMQLPIHTMPTIDVLHTFLANNQEKVEE